MFQSRLKSITNTPESYLLGKIHQPYMMAIYWLTLNKGRPFHNQDGQREVSGSKIWKLKQPELGNNLFNVARHGQN